MNAMIQRNSDTSKRSIKDILPSTFFVMKFCGLWEPFNLSSFLKVAYTAYRVVALFAMVTVGISLVCLILFTTKNMKEVFFENSYLLFTLFNAWVKAIILLIRRNDIKSILKVLLKDQCQPLDSVEQEIQNQFDKNTRKFTLKYSTLVGSAVTTMYLVVFFKRDEERIEVLNVWRPYNLRVDLYFWITWIHEFVGHIVTASVHIAADTLIPGLMIQLSCQLKFLRHRLIQLPLRIEKILNSGTQKRNVIEKYLISATARHHNIIYELANKFEQTFLEALFTQFLISFIIICFSVFKISKGSSVDYSALIILSTYTGCMLSELFLYCWFGNELMINSIDLQEALNETNWLSFEDETKKSLIVWMIRSRKPILISVCSVISVNIDSFVLIVKTSYSAYNVLRDTV